MSTESQIKNEGIEATVNEWPDSQVCIGCKHAEFTTEGHGDSAYACLEGCTAETPKCESTRQEASDEEWRKKFESYNPFYQKPTSYHPQAPSRLDDNKCQFSVEKIELICTKCDTQMVSDGRITYCPNDDCSTNRYSNPGDEEIDGWE